MKSDFVYVDPTSPSGLRWKIRTSNRVSVGDVAGSFDKATGYWRVVLNGKRHWSHRLIYEICSGEEIPIGLEVDHIDTDKTHNEYSNFRLVTHAVNGRNVKQPRTNTSGVTGVSFHSVNGYDYWQASWTENRKSHGKTFSVMVHGHDVAFRLACEYRDKQISRLNTLGAGYSSNHGKERDVKNTLL